MSSGKVLIIGISGVTCGGKTTLAEKLKEIIPHSKLVSQDDYFYPVEDPHHVWISELNHINFDILSSMDMEKMHEDIENIIGRRKILPYNFNKSKKTIRKHDAKSQIDEKIDALNLKVIIVEGFCIFNYKPIVPLFHLKYYFTLEEEECKQRRDIRVYEPPDCPGYFEMCVWPEHCKQIEEVKSKVSDVRYFNSSSNNCLNEVLSDIAQYLSHYT